jgi:hypothetical protein
MNVINLAALVSQCGFPITEENKIWIENHECDLIDMLERAMQTQSVIFEASTTFFNPEVNSEKIVCGENFRNWFSRKIERQPLPVKTPNVYVGETSMSDRKIIAALGGEDNAETSLALIWWLINVEISGKNSCDKGLLILERIQEGGIFYVRDDRGILRVVLIARNECGRWGIEAYILHGCNWSKDTNIFTNYLIKE